MGTCLFKDPKKVNFPIQFRYFPMFSSRSTAFLTASVVLLGSTACMVPIDLSEDTALSSTVWELQQIQLNDGTLLTPDAPQNYTVEFSEAGEVFVQADCNRAIGAFTLEDGMISITMGPTTLAACPDNSIGGEFLTNLNNANIVFFEGEDMFIDLALDSGTMQFSPAAAEESALTGRIWQLQDIQFNDGTLLTAEPPENYTVEFADDGTLAIQADCNRGSSSFTIDAAEQRLTIDPIATTMAACPEGSIANDFVSALNNSAIYFFQDGNLFIDIKYGSGTMRFAESTQPTLVGTVWKLQQIQFNDDTLLIADPPENYTVEFLADGQVAVQADCNRGSGSFTTTDNRLTIGELATTRAACPPGSISDDFLRALGNSAGYFFQDGSLFIDLGFDTGTMQFSAN
jgi:heat shock protein HslJ